MTAFAAVALVGAFGLPLLGLVVRAPWSRFVEILGRPETLDALRLSLVCSVLATTVCIVVGFPVAWVFARVSFPGRSVVRALALLPLVLPPVVGGLALFAAFGRRGLVGSWLDSVAGIRIPFTTTAAVIAETFVALPFFVVTVEGALRGLDPRFEEAAAASAARPWTVVRRVTLPMILPSIGAATALAWARALGEFGATITFAGNLPGRTQTLPLAIYLAFENGDEAGIVLGVVMLAVSVAVLVMVGRRVWGGGAHR